MAISVSPQDVTDAEDFLVEYMGDNIPEGDYTDGSLLRDMAIKAISFTIAYLKSADGQIRARQSLKSLGEVDTSDDEEAADDAADAIISNWFATRNRGGVARVVAYGTASQRVDITIGADKTFNKTGTLAFQLDNAGEDLYIAAEDLIAQFDSTGEVTGYTFRFPLVAQTSGTAYDIEPGRFAYFDDFSPYVTSVSTLVRATGGTDVESTVDFIERSKNLASVRNLINNRSCDAVLRDEYDTIRRLAVVGMGDTEMIRDRVRDSATGLEIHTGGHQDIFVDIATVETSFSGVVGARFTRPDGVINVFRDPDYLATKAPGQQTFFTADPVTGSTILAGMALRIWTGLPIDARDYIIREVRETELLVSEKVPFPVATDVDGTFVRWSVGQEMPSYQDVVGQTITGETSQQIQNSGRIVLPGGPLYAIKEVTIADSSDPDADPTDGLIHFEVRTNDAPTEQVAPDNEFQIVVHNPENHQSERSYADLIVGVVGELDKYDGKTVKVTYDTLSGFAAVDTRVGNRRDRISGANPLTRAYHPIYLSFTMEWKALKSATAEIDEATARDLLVGYINGFPPTEVIDVSGISRFFQQAYPAIVGQVLPFTIGYEVHVPDGRVVQFETTDSVEVPANVTELRRLLVSPDDPIESLLNPLEYGLADDVMRYLAIAEDISITQRA